MRHGSMMAHTRVLGSFLLAATLLVPARAGEVQTRLIFPDLIQGPAVDVGYAVSNPLGQAAEVTFTAYGNDGNLLDGAGVTNPVMLEVGPHSQLARFPADLFGFDVNAAVSGWMEVTSDSEEIKGFFITLEDGLDRVDGADASIHTATSFILMFPPDANPAQGIIHVVNPGDAAANVTVDLFSAAGAQLDSAERIIPGHGKLRSAPADLVGQIENNNSVYLKVTSDQPVAAYQSFRVGDSIAGLNGIVAEEVEVLYSPQLGTGPVINSLLQLVNTANTSETLTLTARDESGALLADVGPSPQGQAANPRQIVLAAGALFQSDMAAFFGIPVDELRSGWIEVRHQNDEPISVVGSILFGDSAGGVFNASLPLQSVARFIHLYSHVADGTFGSITWFTGLATLNTTGQDANVSVTVRDPAGAVTAAGGYLLKAGERLSKTLPEILPGFGPQAGGSIEVVSDVEIFSFSLFALADLSVLAAIPTQPFNLIEVLDGSEPVGGVIQAPVIRIPAGTVLNPDGPLELIGDQSVIVDGDIVSDSAVTIRSPGGTVLVSGKIDTTAEGEPGSTGIFKNGRKVAGEEPQPPGIRIEAETIVIEGEAAEEPIPDDPHEVQLPPQLAAGSGNCTDGGSTDGGSVVLAAKTVLLVENWLGMEAGSGCPGEGSEDELEVVDSKHGGDVGVFTDYLLKGIPEEESFLSMKAGDGGWQKDDFKEFGGPSVDEAYGANGGNGGFAGLGLKHSTVETITLQGGRGGGGQNTLAIAGIGENAISKAGSGGDGGDIDISIVTDQSGEQSLLSVGPPVGIYGRVLDGGIGGNAAAVPGNGNPGQKGGDGTAVGGAGGRAGQLPEGLPASVISGTSVFTFDLDRDLGNPNPDGGNADVGDVFGFGGGNGGHSEKAGVDGGDGGEIQATAGKAKEDHAADGRATVERAANGGNGFNGCPDQPGSDGGRGGDITTVGRANKVTDSGNGGNGARGTTGGLGGFPGSWTQQTPSNIRSIQGDNGTSTNSFDDGEDGEDGCPTEGTPEKKTQERITVGPGPTQTVEITVKNGRAVRLKFKLNFPTASLLLIKKDEEGNELDRVDVPAEAIDFEAGPPFDLVADINVGNGRWCVLYLVFTQGISVPFLIGEFEVPPPGGNPAHFYGSGTGSLQGGSGALEIELDLSECCELGSLFEVSGTVDNPNEELSATLIQFINPETSLIAGTGIDFAALGRVPAGVSEGTFSQELPDGNYDVVVRGSHNNESGRSNFIQRFAGAIQVAGAGAQGNFGLAGLFPLDVTVNADDFLSIFFRQGGVEVQTTDSQVTALVPGGSLDVEVRRRVREEGTNFIVGELSWSAGQTSAGVIGLAGGAVEYTFPDVPPLTDVSIFLQDELGNPIADAIISWESEPLTDAPDMTFFGARRTEEDGFLHIPMPAGTYDLVVELTQ